MFEDIPPQCPIVRNLVRDVFRPDVQGSAITVFDPLAAQRNVLQTRVLFLSLSGSGGGQIKHAQCSLPAVFEGMGWLVFLRGCTKQ